MATRIYYFTGTGNSLWAARRLAERLAERLGDTTLTPMVRSLDAGDVRPDEDRVGLVFPVYMYRMPHVVRRFVEQLETSAPVFAVATCGGDPGDLFAGVRRALAARGIALTAAHSVAVVSNYAPFGGAPDDTTLADRLESAGRRLDEIADALGRGEAHVEPTRSRFRALVHPGLLYRLGHKYAPVTDRKYEVEDSCDGCGICALVCPVDNLRMMDERPVWLHHCEQCMACLQWCPQEAIQVGDKTRGERRYHHPDVRSKDLVAQKPPRRKEPADGE